MTDGLTSKLFLGVSWDRLEAWRSRLFRPLRHGLLQKHGA